MDVDTATYSYLTTAKDNGEDVEEEEEKFSYFKLLDKPRILPPPVKLTHEHLKDINYELGLIKLCWDKVKEPFFEDRTVFPSRYISNTEKEKALVLYTENFRKKFITLYPNRKPMFLVPENECGFNKMVCTTLRPTSIPYPEFEEWESASKFMADYIAYEPLLDYPTILPRHLYSPHTTIMRQKGHCFAMATVLCSILIGIGYDAYVVSGYATKDIALRILVRVDCPFPPFKEEQEKPPEKPKLDKYVIAPPKDLRSKFLLMMEKKELDRKKAEEEKLMQQEKQKLFAEEKEPIDELEGQRVHAWVLVMKGKRKVTESFFVEPNSGYSHSIHGERYLGIESIWNNQNYWINLQDCSNGLENIDYNLKNNNNWIHLLYGEPHDWRERRPKQLGEEDDNRDMYEEQHLDMPISWSSKLIMPHDRYKKRYAGGTRITNYKRTLVEQYAPYVSTDGLVRRITRYKDFECTLPYVIEEYYENRQDKFFRSIYDYATNYVTDYFLPGRDDAINKHIYTKDSDAVDADRSIFFNHTIRTDNLYKLDIEKHTIKENFKDRADNCFFRQSFYLEHTETKKGQRRTIQKIIQKYLRDENKPSHDDIAIREFLLLTREIHLKYHYGSNNVTASTRVFIKPPISEFGEEVVFEPNLTYGYQAEIRVKSPPPPILFLMYEQQIEEEESCINGVREIENQLSEFLLARARELVFCKLDVSLFNREENEEYKKLMLEKEEMLRAHKEKEIEEETDYLAPYIIQYNLPLSYTEAVQAKKQCLQEYKEMMVHRANDLHKQHEKLDEELQAKKNYYTANHDKLSPAEEALYFEQVNQIIFTMKTIQTRMARHKELASVRVVELNEYLDKHPLLQILTKNKPL